MVEAEDDDYEDDDGPVLHAVRFLLPLLLLLKITGCFTIVLSSSRSGYSTTGVFVRYTAGGRSMSKGEEGV